jgi:hypothetical protein
VGSSAHRPCVTDTNNIILSEWDIAIAAARAAGHTFTEDPSNPVSGRWRVICANPACDQAVLRPRNYTYGGATEQPCKPWPATLTPAEARR